MRCSRHTIRRLGEGCGLDEIDRLPLDLGDLMLQLLWVKRLVLDWLLLLLLEARRLLLSLLLFQLLLLQLLLLMEEEVLLLLLLLLLNLLGRDWGGVVRVKGNERGVEGERGRGSRGERMIPTVVTKRRVHLRIRKLRRVGCEGRKRLRDDRIGFGHE
jgi:hypothetical protein